MEEYWTIEKVLGCWRIGWGQEWDGMDGEAYMDDPTYTFVHRPLMRHPHTGACFAASHHVVPPPAKASHQWPTLTTNSHVQRYGGVMYWSRK